MVGEASVSISEQLRPDVIGYDGALATRRRSLHVVPDPVETSAPVMMVTTQGGHLAQLVALESWWARYDRIWVAPPTSDVSDKLSNERVVTSYYPTTRNLWNAVRNFALAVRILLRERPAVLVSAGAGVAVPFFLVAWVLRIPTVFIEVYDRIDSATMTGRLCGPFTTRRFVQWESQVACYPDAEVVGPLL
jgi:UDP-N-acetylglucosamine:LPS N-acetylglucosamine transferase